MDGEWDPVNSAALKAKFAVIRAKVQQTVSLLSKSGVGSEEGPEPGDPELGS